MRPILLIRDSFQGSFFRFGFDIIPPEDVKNFFQPGLTDENTSQLELDLPRHQYVDEKILLNDLKGELRKSARQENYIYYQGDLTGSSIGSLLYFTCVITPLQKNPEFLVEHREEDALQSEATPRLYFTYLNDDGIICSLSLLYNRFNHSQWIFLVLQNAAAPIQQRRQSIYLHDISFPSEEEQLWSSFEDITRTIGSKMIGELLAPIFDLRTRNVNDETVKLIASHIKIDACNKPSTIMEAHPDLYPNFKASEKEEDKSDSESTTTKNSDDEKGDEPQFRV